jgi:hypothetical protein
MTVTSSLIPLTCSGKEFKRIRKEQIAASKREGLWKSAKERKEQAKAGDAFMDHLRGMMQGGQRE